MFADTLTVGGNTLVKINQDAFGSTYRYAEATFEVRLNIRHTQRKDSTRGGMRVDRHNVEIVGRIYATEAGGFDTIRKHYLVVEVDYNDNPAQYVPYATNLSDWLIASSDAAMTKFLNWES
jgi:hypothetical protein